MKVLSFLCGLLLIFFSGLHNTSAQTCSAPATYTTSTSFACSDSIRYIPGSSITNFPTGTTKISVIALFKLIDLSGSGCGSGYSVNLFTLTTGASDTVIMSLSRTSDRVFAYSAYGSPNYDGQDVGSGKLVFNTNDWVEVKLSVDLTAGKANMATSYLNDLHFNAQLPGTLSFPGGLTFDGNTKLWFGGAPSATRKYGVTVEKITVWNGYLPVVGIGSTYYPGEILLGHSPVLVAEYKLQDDIGTYVLTNSVSGTPGYLGASTSGTSDTTNSPTWVNQRGVLSFSNPSKFISLPAFTIPAPNGLVAASVSVSFWIKLTSGSNYIFRYSNSGLSTDRLALKSSGTNLQMCASTVCQTAFSGLTVNTWTLITANWAFRNTRSPPALGCYYSVYANNQLLKAEWISGTTTTNVNSIPASDKVRFGGFTGQLAAIKIYSPGSLQLSSASWCDDSSSNCGGYLGATFPSTCTTAGSCDSSCTQCTDGTPQGCLTCASGKYFQNGQCITCNGGTITGDVCVGGCPANCAVCPDATTCTTCSTGYFKTGTGACSSCPSNCDTCSDGSTCTVCSTGFKIYEAKCYNPCPVKTYALGSGCSLCPAADCDYCGTDGSACTQCSSDFHLYGGACYDNCPVTTYADDSDCEDCPDDCDECDDGNTCTDCTSGFHLYQGECYDDCPVKTYVDNSDCEDCPDDCDECDDGDTCTDCTTGFYLYNGECHNPCPATTYENDPICSSCPSDCDYCSSDGSDCTQCSSGYYLHGTTCVDDCPSGTFLADPNCEDCPDDCDECSDANTCQVCSATFYLYQDGCVDDCPFGTFIDPNDQVCSDCSNDCKTCDDENTCTMCDTGFYLYQDECHDPCPITTYEDGPICSLCPNHCDECTDGNTCTDCSSGYFLDGATQCVNPCPTTTFGDTSTHTCEDCPDDCDTCTDELTCTDCTTNFFLYQSQCHSSCPSTTYPVGDECFDCISDCQSCPNGSTCSLCVSSHYLYQSQCHSSCPIKTYTVGSNCLDCSSNCDTCLDGNTCTVCSSSHYLYQQKCFSSCPITTYTSSPNCFDCPSNCDTCVDGNTCSVCSSGYNIYQQLCYNPCPSQAPYISPTVSPNVCLTACPTQTPYVYQKTCYKNCPAEAPYVEGYQCSPNNPDTAEEVAKLGNTVGSTASTVLVTRNVVSSASAMMFGSLMKLLQYTRYMNVSHSDRLEVVFQTITDSGDYIPMPTMSDEMQNAFETAPVPYVFERYELLSNFMLNEGDDILKILTVLALFFLTWVLQKIIVYLRNLPIVRPVIVKSRLFLQNYLVSEFYEMLGDVTFACIFEFKAFSLEDQYGRMSFFVCISCLILGILLLMVNIYIVYQYQKKKKNLAEDESKKKELEKFSEKFEGVEVLFGDFEDRSFIHQAALVFFAGRNILFCLVIATLYSKPIIQAVILLLLDLSLVAYYLIKRSIKSNLDFAEQLTYELVLLTVNVCFLIMAIADSFGGNTPRFVNSISEVVIVLNIGCKFLPFVFLGLKIAVALWEYYGLVKLALKAEMNKNKKKKKRKISTKLSRQFSDSSNALTSTSSPFRSRADSTHILMIDTNGNLDQSTVAYNTSMVQMETSRKRRVKRTSAVVVPLGYNIPPSDGRLPTTLQSGNHEPWKKSGDEHISAAISLEQVSPKRRMVRAKRNDERNQL